MTADHITQPYTLEKLRTTPRDGAILYWRIEDRDGEYVGGWSDPEDVPTLRAAIDEARRA